jgi:co-chaperonin GroES (HSP10)
MPETIKARTLKGNLLLIEEIESNEGEMVTKSGIILHEAPIERLKKAKVIMVGDGEWIEGSFIIPTLKQGDIIYFRGDVRVLDFQGHTVEIISAGQVVFTA